MSSSPNLTYLLPSASYALAYSLPLLCLSLVLTFAGTFLMLDRSRSFPPSVSYSALPGTFDKNEKPKFGWFLEGGIGGLACGYTTGLHSATFLALVIPTKTTLSSLSPKSFLAVWILICIFTTLLTSRYRYAALTMAGVSGGALASLAFCVITHPSLAPRIILISIFAPLSTFLILFFYFVPNFHSRLLHPTLRFCTSANGAFGIVLSISLLLNPVADAWANVWERLWLHDGDSWGTGQEKGLSAAFCVFLVAGAVTDWALRCWFGECPDEKWDRYLASYMTNFPDQAERAGIFEPSKPLLERLFSSNEKHDSTPFPPNSDIRFAAQPPLQYYNNLPPLSKSLTGGPIKKSLIHSRKHGFQLSTTRKRKPIKFGTLDELSSSDEESINVEGSPITFPPLSYSPSTPTLVDESPRTTQKKPTTPNTFNDPTKPLVIDYDAELDELKKLNGTDINGMPDYSDHEGENVASIGQQQSYSHDQSNGHWSPAFIKRHSGGLSISAGPGSPAIPFPSPTPAPTTPSLVKALDRIAIAQRDGLVRVPFAPQTVFVSTPTTSSGEARGFDTDQSAKLRKQRADKEEEEEDNARAMEHARKEREPRWEEFWQEVRAKAQS